MSTATLLPGRRAAPSAFALLLLLGLAGALTPRLANGAAGAAGFVVWESNRSGAFRIWRQDLDGGEPHLLSADEPGRDHCCAKLSPNGSRLVYLSLAGGARRYGPDAGALHLVDADGGRDRVLVPVARHYGEHRAVVWWGEDELVYLDGRNATQRLRLSTGETAELLPPSAGSEGWLVAPGGRIATGNTPTFSDSVAGKPVSPRPSLGGCQPAFCDDGRFAVWSAGAGGPIDAFELATRRSWTILEKGDSHFPAGRGYLYFPALSNDASLLAVGASAGEHDHFRADYDIFVVELDPDGLQPRGKATPVAPDPAVDRFPDLYRPARPGRARDPAKAPPAMAAKAGGAPSSPAELQRGLVFLWRTADAENRVTPASASEILRPHGVAWTDRHGALALGGGSFSAGDESASRLAAALQAKHQWTISVLVTPASLAENGPLVAFSDGPRARNLVLRQKGDRIVLDLRTSDSAKEGASITVAHLASTAPAYLAFTFSPGRLDAFVDGARTPEVAATIALPGDLFPWRPRLLGFGAEPASGERWHGTLSEIAIWNRPLTPPEIAAEAARVRALVNLRASVPRTIVLARLLAASPSPSLDEISPYREALVVDEYEVVKRLAGPPMAAGAAAAVRRIRVVRWAILDGQQIQAPAAGASRRLILEPFAVQPQLESFFLGDRLPANAGLALYFDLGATADPASSAAP
ncbi:MAG: LamG-like jellyroll fold domain-containing protein [Thermoanaerobaculia bacterium]